VGEGMGVAGVTDMCEGEMDMGEAAGESEM